MKINAIQNYRYNPSYKYTFKSNTTLEKDETEDFSKSTFKERFALGAAIGMLLASFATISSNNGVPKENEVEIVSQDTDENTVEDDEPVEQYVQTIIDEEKLKEKQEVSKTNTHPEKKAIKYAKEFEFMTEQEVEKEINEDLPNGAWCAAFLHHVVEHACPDNLPKWYKKCVYVRCASIYEDAKEHGALITDLSKVKPGDFAIIKRGSSNSANHVGMVISVLDDKTVKTIEGNTIGAGHWNYSVLKKTRSTDDERYKILGFARIIQND